MMKVKLYDLSMKAVGEASLNEDVFGLDARPDIIKRVIDWQLAKARAGTHNSKTISEVSGTTKKPFRQKGTGNARQGSLRQVHMRGGGVSHGPVVRSHAYDLPKKVRKLGLRHALSAKHADGKLLVIDNLKLVSPKTTLARESLSKFGSGSFFVVDGNELNDNFLKASRNLHNVVAVPQIGANVYDIIRHDYVIVTSAGLEALEARLKNA
jgi:large subunit ribosomal protein L4